MTFVDGDILYAAQLNALPTASVQLTDMPAVLTGQAGSVLRVAADAHGYELHALSGADLSGVEITADKGQPNGYAGLGSDGKVPASQLPAGVAGALSFAGTWDASANSPALTNTPAANGTFYIVATAGTTSLATRSGAVSQWNVGDLIFSDGTYWDKLDGQPTEVVSVAGRTGAVVLSVADVSGAAPLASPPFTGTPTAPGPANNDNSTALATTAWVRTLVQTAGYLSGASAVGWSQLPAEAQNLPLGFVLPGKPGAGQVYNLVMAMAVTIPNNLAGSVGYAGTVPTGGAAFGLNKIAGGVTTTALGTLTFAAGMRVLTLSTQAGASLAAGDVLQLVAPATQDATLSDLGITILCAKV